MLTEFSIMEGVSFKDAITIIDKVDKTGKPYPFDISFRTLNRNSKKGGRLLTYLRVKKFQSVKKILDTKSLIKAIQSEARVNRNPEHYSNRTRNLELQNGELKKIHIRLIDTINGKKMHY
jgi:hypothetical protein